MKELLIIVPSRERPDNITGLIDAWRETTSGNSELLICLDEDDAPNYSIPEDVSLMVRPRMRLGPWLNYAATTYQSPNPIQFIGFMGDDHRPRTPDWDRAIVEPLRNRLGVSYGDDLFQRQNLATAAFMNKKIVDTVGYFCPPKQTHLYLDDYWMSLGRSLGNLAYVPDVVIEHMHFSLGKSEPDRLYLEVNSGEMYTHDFNEYDSFVHGQFITDMEKLRGMETV